MPSADLAGTVIPHQAKNHMKFRGIGGNEAALNSHRKWSTRTHFEPRMSPEVD